MPVAPFTAAKKEACSLKGCQERACTNEVDQADCVHDVDCPATSSWARSDRSWVFAVEHCDIDALGQADLSQLDSRNADCSALHACIDVDWAVGAQYLLLMRADPSLPNSHGHAPIHAAAIMGRRPLLELLLDASADLNAQDRDMEGDEEFRGGQFEKKTTNRTALHYAAEALDYYVCDLLLLHGAEANVRDCWYKTPLHLVEDEPASEEQMHVMELLLHNTADPNLGNLERGPNQTSLLVAVYEKNFHTVDLLIQGRADLLAKGKQGMCALHLAARMRSEKLAMMLLNARADPAQKTPSGLRAADLARSNGCRGLAELLESEILPPGVGSLVPVAGTASIIDEIS